MHINRKRFGFFVGDIFIVTFSFLFLVWLKPATIEYYIPRYSPDFFIFLGLWLVVSLIAGKYRFDEKKDIESAITPVLISNLIILALVSSVIVALNIHGYSRMVYFGTIFVAILTELFLTILFSYSKGLTEIADFQDQFDIRAPEPEADEPEQQPSAFSESFISDYIKQTVEQNRKLILEESNERVLEFVEKYINLQEENTALFSTTTRFNIIKQPDAFFRNIVNLRRINDIKRINKFFEAVNDKIPKGGLFICSVETKNLRKKRIFTKYPPIIREIYYTFDFIYKRVFPKLKITRGLYFFINGGHNRVLSKQETLGRLYSCGFEYVHDALIDNLVYIVARKVKKPKYDYHPSYGLIFRMKRAGKNGKPIYVYKLRTMYPYSEYLQEYIYKYHKLDESGKFKRDIRVTTLGRIFRRFWLDELPMIFNLLKGDLKLIGVRPLSFHYLSLYPDEYREKRMKHKPGLIPPYYADLPKDLDGVIESERKYLELFEKHPFRTDVNYFFRAIYNIIVKRARSK